MKVSIVTISYNQGRFLEATLRSVIEQDYGNIEYIVIDAGSSDGSRDTIRKYRSSIAQVLFESDSGPADGLRKGFDLARGDVLAFLNSDDVLLPGAVSEAVNCFTTNENLDLVTGHGFVIDAVGRRLRKIYSDRYSLLFDAYGLSLIVQPSSFFTRQIYQSTNGFNKDNHCAWDDELFYNMALAGAKVLRADKFWSEFRLYPESITGGALLERDSEKYFERKFLDIMGRKRAWYDKPINLALRIFKHICQPKAMLERIAKGPIYGQG
jgi:glycosyltransferase involved in cell wall biosynthesis